MYVLGSPGNADPFPRGLQTSKAMRKGWLQRHVWCLQWEEKLDRRNRSCASSKLTCSRREVFSGRDGEAGGVSRSHAMLHDPTGDPCPKPWAVVYHLSPTSCWRSFLPFLLPVPFQKQPDQKLMKQRQTERGTYKSSLMPHITAQYRSEQDLVPPSPLVWELSHDPAQDCQALCLGIDKACGHFQVC